MRHSSRPEAAEPELDLDPEQRVITAVLVVAVVVLGLVPGLISGAIADAMPWILGGVR